MSNSEEEGREGALPESQELILPVEQQTLLFYGKPILVIRLPDGRPAIVLRSFCENMQIDTNAQVKRIRRTEAIADDLVNGVQVETTGGPQAMAALILRAVPFWLAGIDPKRVREEIRPDILHYQREVVDVLYAWVQTSKALPTAEQASGLVPAEPVPPPARPEQGAALDEWREYYLRMAAVMEWQMDVELWRGNVESRLEGVEAMTSLIPEILDRLGPETLTMQHQRQLQASVRRLHEASGKAYATVYDDLKTAFGKPRYQELLESEWPDVERWFTAQIERAKGKPR